MGISFKDLAERVIELVDYYCSCASVASDKRKKAKELATTFLNELEQLLKD